MVIGGQLISDAERVPEGESLRDDAVCANGKRNDNITINDEENAIFFGDIKIENLVAMPENAREFMTAQRRMAPVRREEREFRASGALNFGGKISKFSLEPNGPAIDHRSSTASSIAA